MSPLTLYDLTERFLAAHPHLPRAMYRTTANHIAGMLGHANPADVVITHTAKDLPARLEQYLCGHARSSSSKVRNNKSQAKAMIQWGIETGLIPATIVPSPAWREVWTQKRPIYGKLKIGRAFMVYCAERGIEPHDVTATHFHAWREEYERSAMQEKSGDIVRNYVCKTRAQLLANADRFPRLVAEGLFRAHPIRIPLSRWPASLQQEWRALEAWLTRPRVLGRQGRPWTPGVVHTLQGRLEELYGFLTDRGVVASTLREMVAQDSLRRFLVYKFEEKDNCARSILSYCTSFRKVLDYCRVPSHWLEEEILAALPAEDLEWRPVPRHTILSYTLLAELPRHLDRAIAAMEKTVDAAKENREWKRARLALLWRLKVVFLFLLYLSWRITNITHLRWGTIKDLARYQVPTCQLRHGLLYHDPASRRWRFFFPATATKNGRVVQGDVPAAIVPTLERYLSEFWPLLRARDRSFLFPNSEGRLSESSEWSNIIKRETFRYLGAAVSPHKFRHAFAFYYLTQRPEDYLTLSRYLWHRSVEVTIRIYGGFEPEDALRLIEAWRAGHHAAPDAPPSAVLDGSPPPGGAHGVVVAGPGRRGK